MQQNITAIVKNTYITNKKKLVNIKFHTGDQVGAQIFLIPQETVLLWT